MIGIDGTLAALADPARRRTIELLRGRPRRAGELANLVELSPPAMSRHLRMLKMNGLVDESPDDPRDSRVRIYRLRREPFEQLRTWLDEVESFWKEQLGGFKEHAERRQRGRRK
jgi:DNA-binding transcriptional ArsR family regulator